MIVDVLIVVGTYLIVCRLAAVVYLLYKFIDKLETDHGIRSGDDAGDVISNGGMVLDFFNRRPNKHRSTFPEKANRWIQNREAASKEVK